MPRSPHPAASRGLGVLAVVAMLTVAGCGAARPATAPPVPGTEAPATSPAASEMGPTPIVVDADLGLDDTMALPFLLREPSLDVIAVTVVGTGLVHCGAGLQNANDILATLGIDDVPVACGRSEPLNGTHAFPAEWRAMADDGYGLALERRAVSIPDEDAPALIRSLAGSAERPITLVTLGPLTNVAEALRDDLALAARIERIVAMAGAVDVPGNVYLGAQGDPPLTAEWNVYADPTAADIVFRSGVPITIVPLDATNDVPLDATFVDALEADHAAAPADIAYELVARRGTGLGEYLWDQLASVIAVDDSVATFETTPLRVVTAEGPDSGRTVRTDDGVAVRVATSADRAAFEKRFLAGLRLGAPRPHPFTIAGTISLRSDGSTCADDAPDTLAAGDWAVDVVSTFEGELVVPVVSFHEGTGWDDLLAYFATATDPTAQPDFVDVPAYTYLDGPSSTRLIVSLTPATYGLVCLYLTEAEQSASPGSGPFTVAP